MIVKVHPDGTALAAAAAADAAQKIRDAIATRGSARIIAATGASQMAFLEHLVREPGVDWSKVEMFHLDEYVGLPPDHPASFRKYLMERLIRPAGISKYHLLDGQRDPQTVSREMGQTLNEGLLDVALVGIGENGHLAFNDPPADFETDAPYIVVKLDERCRQQQVGEGWFASVTDVPETAISMSVRQILRARAIVCVVPDARKAEAVRNSLEGPLDPMTPASILRTHPDVAIYLDEQSASLLESADE
jgi:glucosamine-6-phosphate deaminase